MNFIADTLGRVLLLALGAVIVCLIGIPLGMLRALVIIDLWNLFGASTFNMAAPPFWTVMGLVTLYTAFVGVRTAPDYRSTDDSKTKVKLTSDRSLVSVIAGSLAMSGTLWAIGHLYFWLGS